MKHGVQLVALGHTASLFLAITFTLCVLFDVIFPQWAMYQAWQRLLPGFHGLDWGSYFLGLVESYGYGWYFALIWAPLYNVFTRKSRDV